MTENVEGSIVKATLPQLCAAASHYAVTSPAVARFFMKKVNKTKHIMGIGKRDEHLSCQTCGNVFRPDNHRVRILPKRTISSKMQRIVNKQEEGSVLGKFQQRLAKLWSNNRTRVVITCDVCERRTVLTTREESTRVWPLPKSSTEEDLSQSSLTDLKPTRAMRKKQKKRQKRREKLAGGAICGLGRTSVSTDSGLDFTLDSRGTPACLGAPQFSSTPLVPSKHKLQKQEQHQQHQLQQNQQKQQQQADTTANTPVWTLRPDLLQPSSTSASAKRSLHKADTSTNKGTKFTTKDPTASLFGKVTKHKGAHSGKVSKRVAAKKNAREIHSQLQTVLDKEKQAAKKTAGTTTLQCFLSSL